MRASSDPIDGASVTSGERVTPGTTGARINALGKLGIVGQGSLIALAIGGMVPIMPAIGHEFANYKNLGISMALTGLGVGVLVGAPAGGRLGDLWNRNAVMAISCFIVALASVGVIFTHTLPALIGARFVIGLGVGALTACVVAAIGDTWQGEERDRWFGLMNFIATAVSLLVFLFIGYLARDGWRMTFLPYLIALPTAFCVWYGFTSPSGIERQRTPPLRFEGILLAIIVLGIVAGEISTGMSLYTAFRFYDVGLKTPLQVAHYSLPAVFTPAFGSLTYEFVRRRLSIAQVMAMGGGLFAIGSAFAAGGGSLPVVTFGLAFACLGVGYLLPNLSACAVAVARPEQRGSMAGIMQGAIFGGPFVCQFLVSRFYNHGGASAALWCITGLAGLLAVAMALSGRRLVNAPATHASA